MFVLEQLVQESDSDPLPFLIFYSFLCCVTKKDITKPAHTCFQQIRPKVV